MRRAPVILFACALILTAQDTPLPAAGVLNLDQAINEALAKNLDLAVERFNISIAEARMITARLRPNPVITLSGDHLDVLGTHYNNTNNGGPNEYAYRTDFVIERGRKRDLRMGLAAADRSAAELGVKDLMRKVAFDVQSAFVEVLQAKQNLVLALDNLRSLNGIVNVNTVRVKAGDLAGVELTRSQVAELQYQTSVQQAQLAVIQARNRLRLLIGRTEGAEIDAAGDMRMDAVAMPPLAELQNYAQQQRPDLQQLEATQARSQSDLRLQLANGKIDYTVGTEYRRQQAISGRGNSLGVFVSMPMPIFNRNQGEIARAKQEIEQSAARVRALRAGVGLEVLNAYQQYDLAKNLLRLVATTTLGKAQQVKSATEYSYRRGEASLIEFLDAQRTYNDAVQSLNQARADYARSLYLIESVTGRLLPPAPANTASTSNTIPAETR
jgi:cobalt-zinc-cadmium efflux system outer membrane protein